METMQTINYEQIEKIISEYLRTHLTEHIEELAIITEKKAKEISLIERIVKVEEELKYLREDMKNLREDMNKRFEAIDKRFEDMHRYMDKRFEDMYRYMDKRFEDMQKQIANLNRLFIFGISFLTAIILIIRFVFPI